MPVYPRETWRPDVYPQYYPGPNAVRICNAHYVQEYRPSGPVITPRMHCYWRPGLGPLTPYRPRTAPISPAPITSADVP